MLSSRMIGGAAIFAAVYAVLNIIPVSPLLGPGSSFLSLSEVFSPLAGMVLGPLTGGLSVVAGTFLSVALGKPLAFDGLDFIPPLAAAVTAGLVTSRRVMWAVSFSLGMFALFTADPLSPKFIVVNGVPVPFLWMHVLSVIVILVVITRLNTGSWVTRGALIASTVFISTMNAHVAGGIVYENVFVRINGVLTPAALSGIWTAVFFVYPVERAFFTLVGSALAIPVLRRMPRRVLVALRGEDSIFSVED